MRQALPDSQPSRPTGANGDHLATGPRKSRDQTPLPHGLEYWEDDAVGLLRQEQPPGPAGNGHAPAPPADLLTELERLRAENSQLQELVNEAVIQTEQSCQADQVWAERQKEYEGLLEEKSEVIRDFHAKLREAMDSRPPVTPREEELIAMSEEIERERCEMQRERQEQEQERRQLKEDEESLMQQMREMEIQMSRERADLARQRNEVQRLHTEIRHELELASRDATLRERLLPFQRRHQDLVARRTAEPPPPCGQAPQPAEQAPANSTPDPRNGLFKRLFGKE